MIKIILDSTSDCPGSCFDLFAPLTVSLGGRDYRDGIDLTPDRFYQLLTATKEFPKTSQPSPEDFAVLFEKVKADADEAICFTVSSVLSGTYQSACIAKELTGYPNIHIIDTKLVSHPIGILAAYAAEKIRQGLSAREIVEECQTLKGKIRVIAGLDTLEYLYKGGRVSRTGAAVGTVAGIKPIITLTPEGTINAAGKAIGVNRAIGNILSRLQETPLDPRFPLYTLYTQGTENLEKLEDKLAQAGFPAAQRRQVGPTIGAHVGPGVYGVAYVVE